MTKAKTAALVAASVIGGAVIGQTAPATAQVGDILKGAGIALIVDKFSGDIDRFVNTVTGNKTNNIRESTRVVPILSVGKGTFVGAVQVTGPKNVVDKVKAVAQVEGSNKIAGTEIRVRALIPVATTRVNDPGSLSRVKGVGVSALVDAKL